MTQIDYTNAFYQQNISYDCAEIYDAEYDMQWKAEEETNDTNDNAGAY